MTKRRTRSGGTTLLRLLALLTVLGLLAAACGGDDDTLDENAEENPETEGAQEFAAAWDHVLTAPGTGRIARPRPDLRKVTDMTLFRHVEQGLVKPLLYRGEVCTIRRKHCNTALLRLLARQDAAERRIERGCADGS